jgi:hypothetical protein
MSDRCHNIREHGRPCSCPATVRLFDPTERSVAYTYCEACWPYHWEWSFELGLEFERIAPVPK